MTKSKKSHFYFISNKTNSPFTHYTWYDRKCIKMSFKKTGFKGNCVAGCLLFHNNKNETKKQERRVKTFHKTAHL